MSETLPIAAAPDVELPADLGAQGPAADPEIAALLDFEPVPRKVEMPGGWTPQAQRDFIARLAVHGSPGKACEEIDKNRTGATKLYKSRRGASFRAAWDAAVALATWRNAERSAAVEYVTPGATVGVALSRLPPCARLLPPLPLRITRVAGGF